MRLLCEGGAVDQDVADDLGIGLSTLYRWKAEFRDFREALKRGKEVADDMVENALFRRATGYSHDAIKIVSISLGNNMGSEIQQIPYVEHVPPDTTAGIFWLKNRRKDLWRDKVEQQVTGEITINDQPDLSSLSKDERAVFGAIIAKIRGTKP